MEEAIQATATSSPKRVWTEMFERAVAKQPFKPQALITMEVILKTLESDDSNTLQEIVARMRWVRSLLVAECLSAGVSVDSSGELFTLFITRAPTELEQAENMVEVRKILIERGKDFIGSLSALPSALAKHCSPIFVEYQNINPQGNFIITHSWSEAVYEALVNANKKGYNMKVFVTEGRPRCLGRKMVAALRKAGVSSELVYDSALQYCMEKCNFALLGCEGVCPNGGVIAEVGTSNMCLLASQLAKKVYVLCESYKFTHLTILSSTALVKDPKENIIHMNEDGTVDETRNIVPNRVPVDYTPPENVYQIFSDIGELSSTSVFENMDLMFT